MRASVNMADRGYGTMALELDWGPEGEVFTVTNEDFQKESLKYFGYDYSADKMKGLRDLFKNLQTGYFYRLNNDTVKASNDIATAKYGGARGNALAVAVQVNVDDEDMYDVVTYLNETADVVGDAETGTATTATAATMTVIDKQTVVSWDELTDNDYVVFKRSGTISDAVAAATPLTGGTNGSTVTALQYQNYLDAIEPYYFNTLGCVSTESAIQDLIIQFTKRMRDEVGVKFQCVVYDYDGADYEGVISIANKVTDEGENQASLVYWVTGAEASCAVNASCTNKTYDGDFTVDTNYKQSDLEKAITDGKLIFHRISWAMPWTAILLVTSISCAILIPSQVLQSRKTKIFPAIRLSVFWTSMQSTSQGCLIKRISAKSRMTWKGVQLCGATLLPTKKKCSVSVLFRILMPMMCLFRSRGSLKRLYWRNMQFSRRCAWKNFT